MKRRKLVLTVSIVVVCFVVILATIFIFRVRKSESSFPDMKADLVDVGLGDDEDVIESTDEAEKPKEDDTEREVPENDNSVEIQEENIVDDDTDINSIPSSTIVNKDIPVDIIPDLESVYKGDSMELDTDEDGILDGEETLWGLDYKKEDSDGDGLTDFVELNITLTDPLNIDTDGDGITDALADIEGDGIDNQTELSYYTNPLSSDTDGDNLTDYEEIYTYGTDALNVDSDADGLCDYDDVFLGFSPMLADTDSNGVKDSDEKIEQKLEKIFDEEEGRGITKISVSLNISGNAQSNINISSMYGTDMLSSNVVGLVGAPVEISTDSEFEKAIVRFYYDESALGDIEEYKLSILWYDEENNNYRLLDEEKYQIEDENYVFFITSHFSTYMLVDSYAWVDAWKENIIYRGGSENTNQYLDIVFAVDCSGSMDGKRTKNAKKCLKTFVNSMQKKDKAAIVWYTNSAGCFCDFTNDSSILEQGINRLFAEGGTNTVIGMLEALDVCLNSESENKKIVVLISDGSINYSKKAVDLYVEQGIPIYIIDVGNEDSNYLFEAVANYTGGQYYYGATTESIDVNFGYVQGDTIDYVMLQILMAMVYMMYLKN